MFPRREIQRKKLLVIDGDDRLRDSYRQLLLPYGFEVLCCDDGSDAMPLVEEHPDITLVILDLQMHRMDGREWMSWYRARYSQTPVIVITAMTVDDEASLGSTALLKKPFDVAEFLDLVGLFCGLGAATSFRH